MKIKQCSTSSKSKNVKKLINDSIIWNNKQQHTIMHVDPQRVLQTKCGKLYFNQTEMCSIARRSDGFLKITATRLANSITFAWLRAMFFLSIRNAQLQCMCCVIYTSDVIYVISSICCSWNKILNAFSSVIDSASISWNLLSVHHLR